MSFNHIVIQNILRDKWTYISYFLSSVFSILVFFLFSIITFHPSLSEMDTDSTLGIAMMLASFIVYIFSFFFIIYSLYAFLKKKTKSLGIFMIIGASMKQVRKMIFRENMLIAGAAIITAIAFGLIIAPLFLMVAKKVLQADSFGMYFPVRAILLSVILFVILFFVVSKFMTRFINKEEAVILLKADVIQEKLIVRARWKLTLSLIVSGFLFALLKWNTDLVESFGMLYYVALFISLLITIYFIVTQGALMGILFLEKRPSYFEKTNMLFISNLKAKGKSHAHIIYLLTLLLLGVFVFTSVLYSSYYNVKENTQNLYPYSYQYISLPENTIEDEQKDITSIEKVFTESGKYDAYYSEFKTDWDNRIGFMSVSDYNALGMHKDITIEENEYYVAAGNESTAPNTDLINDYPFGKLSYKGLEKRNILSSGIQNVYYVVPDVIYETIDFPVYKVFAYELENWEEKMDVIETISSKVPLDDYNVHLIASKINLYEAEKSVKSIIFFIGFMLSLIFLSAAMSILYFYLQTTLEGEKEKYAGIRKIGLSITELASVVKKELAILIFIPFTFASIILFTAMFSMRNFISMTFFQMTAIGIGIFLLLFIISFFMIRKSYLNKLVN